MLIHDCILARNCHSFSADGKTMGIDVDGPKNDKGLYAVVPIQQQHVHPQSGHGLVEYRHERREIARRIHVAGLARRAICAFHLCRSRARIFPARFSLRTSRIIDFFRFSIPRAEFLPGTTALRAEGAASRSR